MSVFPKSLQPISGRTSKSPKIDLSDEKGLREACAASAEESWSLLETRAGGLSAEEAEERLRRYGPNVLAGEKRKGFVADILSRVKDPLVIQLLVIGGVSFGMGDLRAGIVVSFMIFISVFLGYFQERRSGNAAEKLKLMVQASAVIMRDGKQAELPIAEVVPGDVVVLAAGSIIPADMRIVEAKDFFVTQAALTGESMPVEKAPAAPAAPAASAAGAPVPVVAPTTVSDSTTFDLANACFQGSTVISGAAKAVAVNTGMRTFLGGVAADISGAKGATDFDKGLASFVRLMVRFMLVMVSITFVAVGVTKGDWLQALLFGLSVAVGLTPEMLPMIVTVCLSKGAVFMSRKKVIVKKLKAIQNLGAMDILCTDKTGTITQDKVALERHVDVTNRTSEDVLRYAWMNSYYQTGLRNLLD